MRVPLSWLREFVDVSDDADKIDELVHRLNMSGTEVEDVVRVGADWDQVYVARVVELERHPNADNLYVARLDVGPRGAATVVTGATNLRVGVHAPLVRPGGRLPGGREIRAETMRGIASEGMLCSGDELGLSPDRSGIYLLDEETDGRFGSANGLETGRPLGDLLGETVLDLYITPNRADCMSVLGVAREVHALTGAPLRRPDAPEPRGERPTSELVRVEILDPDLCPRFTAAYLADVRVGPSPGWLQRRLHLAGVRAISNVVDATNYTMLELGVPQHAFDADKLGDAIVVRLAAEGERLVTLDNVERVLDGDMLVIADAAMPVSVAGVMGGASTEVGDQTRNVLLETAHFAPSTIRRSSARLRLRSEASRRFERGLDPDLKLLASRRTVRLLAGLTGGQPATGIVDAYPGRAEPRQVLVHEDQIANLLGRPYSRTQVTDVLESLDFAVDPQGERLLVTVPGHRPDVEGRADLAEEVARISGYDELPETLPTGAPPEPNVDPLRAAAERARDVLVGCGLTEVMTYSLVAPDSADRLLLADTGSDSTSPPPSVEGRGAGIAQPPIRVANPLSEEQSVLRTTLLPSLIETARSNLRHRDGVAVFELARVYLPPMTPLPSERLRLSLVMVGQVDGGWHAPPRSADFFDLKGVVEELFRAFGRRLALRPGAGPGYHSGRCADLYLDGEGAEAIRVGTIGQLHPRAAERFDLSGREVYVGEVEFDALAASDRGQSQVEALTRFPSVDRDLALLLDRGVAHQDVVAAMRAAGGGLLEDVRLFDLYEGPQVSPGKKSLAYTLRFRAPDRTLTDAEVDDVVAQIIAALGNQLGAQVRGSA